jgi:hypothetical protein
MSAKHPTPTVRVVAVLVAVLGLVVLALVLGGGVAQVVASAPGDPTVRSAIVYPPQRLPLIFSHQRHLARGAACAGCHPAATTSTSAVDTLIPTEAACRGCHPIDRAEPARAIAGAPPAACRACHAGYLAGAVVDRVYVPPPAIKFSHAAHAATPCARCHGDLVADGVDLATVRQLPTMASCLGCHDDGRRERACTRCHLAELGGRMQQRFPQGALVPTRDDLGVAHGPGFATHHTEAARRPEASCTACHDRSECVDCHQGTIKPTDFHPGDYLMTHAIEARRGTPDCAACHRAETFCVACHERAGIGTRATTDFNAVDPGRAFHAAGWASAGPGPNLHAAAARRAITSCASCHREEDCLRCHSAELGGPKVSPHPAGWRGSSRCRALDRGNRRMCLRCHVTSDELGCDWTAR